MSAPLDDSHTSWLLGGLRHLREENKYCDITISVQKDSFNCHKVILSAVSPYFDAMFSSGFSESKTNSITLPEMRSDVFKDVLHFIYNGNDVMTSENVEQMLQVACHLQILRLVEKCEDFMISELSIDNCVGLWVTAVSLNCKRLESAAFGFILENFNDIWTLDEFLKLEQCDLKKLVSDDDLRVTSEEVVCQAVLRWVKADNRRRDSIAELLPLMRLRQVEPRFFLEHIFPVPEVHKTEASIQHMQSVLKYHCVPESRHTSQFVDVKLRNFSNKLSVFVVFGRRLSTDGNDVIDLIGYNDKKNKWYTLCSTPLDFGEDFAICPYTNDIWLSGGTKNPRILTRFCAKGCKWVEQPSMLYGRNRHCMVAGQESLYCIGGYKDGAIGSIEEFDLNMHKWDAKGELSFPVSSASAAMLNQNIFIFGGSRGLFIENTAVQCYNTDTNVCSVIANFPSIQKSTRAITYNSEITVVASDGSIFQIGSDMILRKVDQIRDFQRTNYGLYKTNDALYILGGIDLTRGAILRMDCLSDDVVKFGSEDAVSPITEKLPVSFEVFGCYRGVIEPKYPMSDLKETLEFSSFI